MEQTKNKIFLVLTIVISVLLLSNSCVSSKKSVSTDFSDISYKELKKLPAMNGVGKYLSAKLKFNADINGKHVSANGNIKIKRDVSIQIGINALGGLIEVARLEFTPDCMIFIYRLGREYAEVRYDEIGLFNRLGITYAMFEAILLNELFMPNGKSVESELSRMNLQTDNGELLLSTENKGVKYCFHIEKNTGLLTLTQGDYENKITVNCDYFDFISLGERQFPKQIRFSIANIAVDFALSNLKNEEFKLNKTTNVSSYKKVDISNLLKGIKF